MSATDPLRTYLDVLFGRATDGYIEVRHRYAAQGLAAHFYPVHQLAEVAEAVRSRGSSTDVYVGVAPRMRQAGTKDAVGEVWVLWAECDGFAAAAAAHRYRPMPSLIVASGSGPNCHAYWPLATPLEPRGAELANLRLAHTLGADRQCFDAARILRPPGTFNYKREWPAPVTLQRHDANRFSAQDVLERAVELPREALGHRWDSREPRRSTRDPLLLIPPKRYVEDLLGVRPNRVGKVPCPFHTDERPSLHVYPTAARGWCCFSCGRGGSIYDLAAGVWRMQTRGRDFVKVREMLMARYGPQLSRSIDG